MSKLIDALDKWTKVHGTNAGTPESMLGEDFGSIRKLVIENPDEVAMAIANLYASMSLLQDELPKVIDAHIKRALDRAAADARLQATRAGL